MNTEIDSEPPSFIAMLLLQEMEKRQHTAPKRLIAPGPGESHLHLILQSAATAPDHGRINPWKLLLIPPNRRSDLADAFVQALLLRDPHVNSEESNRASQKAFRSPCLILAVLEDAPVHSSVPEADRMLSLGCAIQNMQLMAQALGFGSGITSGKAVNSEPIRTLFNLNHGQKGICFLSFGTIESSRPIRKRPEPSDFFTSI